MTYEQDSFFCVQNGLMIKDAKWIQKINLGNSEKEEYIGGCPGTNVINIYIFPRSKTLLEA